jgi:hypothetical protein
MKYTHYIFIIVGLTLFACNSEDSAQNSEKNQIERTEESVLESNFERNLKTDSFIIVTHNNNFKANEYGISIYNFKMTDTILHLRKNSLNFGKFKAPLMSGKYNMSGAYYPVQFDIKNEKVYFSIYKADEYEGTFEYNKIIEYDLKKKSVREVVSFQNYFPSWYLASYNNKIYAIDNDNKSLISINIKNSKIDTLMKFLNYFDDVDYFQKSTEKLEIISSDRKEGVFKIEINLKTNELSKQLLYPAKSHSSYQEGKVLETFKDFKSDIEELRIYNGANKKSTSFDFKNFNTYWINDSEFLVIKEDEIQKLDTLFNVIDKFRRKNIHIIDVTSSLILISYTQNKEKKLGLLDFNFDHLVQITNVKPEDVVVFKEK